MFALFQPMSSAVSAVFAFAALVIAMRQGQFASIASFGAGAGVAALASAVVGGGTTLAYTTGTTVRQRAVRLVRNTIVLPVIVIATGIAVLLYAVWGQLDPLGVAAGGISTVASVSAELDASYLRRHVRTVRIFFADTLNRGGTLLLIVLGAPFAIAMLVGAVLRAIVLRMATNRDPSRSGTSRIDKSVLALAYEVRLTSLSVLYSVCDRVGALAAPLSATVPVAGGFMAALSAQQNGSGTLLSGLQTTLAARSQQQSQPRWANYVDALLVAVGWVAAVVMLVWREPLVGFLGLQENSEPAQYWVAIALLVPAALASRLFEFRFLAIGVPSKAVVSRAIATVVALCGGILAFVGSQISPLAYGLLLAEVASVLTSLALLAAQRIQLRRGPDAL